MNLTLFPFYGFSSGDTAFYRTKYFLTSLILFLFKILSTSHFSTFSTSIGFPSFFFYPFTCFLYCTIWLTLTTGCIFIKAGSHSLTTFDETTSSISYSLIYLSINFLTGLFLNTKSLVLNNILSPLFYSSVSLLL